MKNKLAKLLRAWAERLDPGHSTVRMCDAYANTNMIQTEKRVLTMQKMQAEHFILNVHDEREREYAELKMREQFGKAISKCIDIEEELVYGRPRLTATLYYYD